jgi:hypothetical protein
MNMNAGLLNINHLPLPSWFAERQIEGSYTASGQKSQKRGFEPFARLNRLTGWNKTLAGRGEHRVSDAATLGCRGGRVRFA